jgi:hypothetical protein
VKRPKRTTEKKHREESISLAGIDFETALRAALETGPMPKTKRKKPKSKKPLRHKG